MAKYKKCKCGKNTARIVSEGAGSASKCKKCFDVCTTPLCGSPDKLGIMAPLIYDEIGVNVCATFDICKTVLIEHPTAVSATIKVIDLIYEYGPKCVRIENINGRPNCYLVTLSNIIVQFELKLFDDACRYLGTVYPTATYLPSDTECETYDEDTNPSEIELEIFAPYGVSYDTCHIPPKPIINEISFADGTNCVRQGINLYAIPKLLDFDEMDETVTVGLTLVLQSLYFAGYKVASEGKIQIPKGSIVTPYDTDCMKFVEGDLLNLAIKPLDLGKPSCEENLKNDCSQDCNNNCQPDYAMSDGCGCLSGHFKNDRKGCSCTGTGLFF